MSGRVPSIATNVHEPGPVEVGAVVQPARIGDGHEAAVAHLEQPDLVGRAEAVLLRPQHAQRAQRVALEHQHDVDEVLEHARAGDGALLGHVPDQDDADAARLGQALQARSGLAHLRDRSGRRGELLVPQRLDGVDDADLGRRRLDRRADRLELGLGEHADAGRRAEALGAQAHLLRRLLAGHEQHRALSADRAQHGRRQARLADARLAAEQHERPGHEAAAEHAIELGDAGADASRGARLDRRERHDDAGLGALAARAAARVVGRGRLLDQRRERAAVGAAAVPAGLLAAALAADVGGAGACHRISQASAAGGR